MVRLHMLHNQVIRLAAVQHGGQVIHPFVGKITVNRIHNRNFFIQNHVGIVGHPIRHHILPLEQIHLMIVHANIANILANFHLVHLSV